jgi:hypothetical protein
MKKQQQAAPAERVFLGFGRAPLERAAAWLVEHLRESAGAGQADVLVALPGARAAQRLEELYARAAPADRAPPRFVTQGALVDALVLLERPVAARFARTLAWERALASLSREQMHALAPGLDSDLRGRMRLAETVRALYGELAPEGRGFEDLARGAGAGETARFAALAAAQREY